MAAPSPRDGDDGGCDAVSESPGDSKLDASFEMDDERPSRPRGLDGESLRELLKEPPGESSTNSLDEARATGGIAELRSCASGEARRNSLRFPTKTNLSARAAKSGHGDGLAALRL